MCMYACPLDPLICSWIQAAGLRTACGIAARLVASGTRGWMHPAAEHAPVRRRNS